MERGQATLEVAEIRKRANAGQLPTLTLRADRKVLIVAPEGSDRLTGVAPLDVGRLIETFDLAELVDDIGRVWGPNLVRPSAHTYISPWVMGGDPVITDTRMSSASVFALRTERDLSAAKIAALYPGLTEESIEDAVTFERRVPGDGPDDPPRRGGRGLDNPRPQPSSGECAPVSPGGVLVVGRAVAEAAVEDADESVGKGSQGAAWASSSVSPSRAGTDSRSSYRTRGLLRQQHGGRVPERHIGAGYR